MASKLQIIDIMTTIKNKNSGNSIAIGAALGVAFGAAYGAYSGNMPINIAMSLAIGTAIGAIFEVASNRKTDV